jgi:hypothetical protein
VHVAAEIYPDARGVHSLAHIALKSRVQDTGFHVAASEPCTKWVKYLLAFILAVATTACTQIPVPELTHEADFTVVV